MILVAIEKRQNLDQLYNSSSDDDDAEIYAPSRDEEEEVIKQKGKEKAVDIEDDMSNTRKGMTNFREDTLVTKKALVTKVARLDEEKNENQDKEQEKDMEEEDENKKGYNKKRKLADNRDVGASDLFDHHILDSDSKGVTLQTISPAISLLHKNNLTTTTTEDKFNLITSLYSTITKDTQLLWNVKSGDPVLTQECNNEGIHIICIYIFHIIFLKLFYF